ncbi:MAG: phosphoribosylformylglycinamidine cyclo-ligase [Sulfobacillus acidophilus]|uniref:Phosphoribosylformylglycinamidine cyclo-ligase n=1 Tax=Sulfobacillus acidophilus TaxID=53633 RepID=A0A2T2WG86_9FIRM|nr:MAG: phosphoribosylformylglycinamidine cyclo-ligase [Sulfobacillus acidophilus]
MCNKERPFTYESTGVSIGRGAAAVDRIKALASLTHRAEVTESIGGFAGGFQLGDAELLAGADGVGSKLLIAHALDQLDTIGIDLVAMNVNDVLASGGEPLFFLDYIAMGRLQAERVQRLVRGIVAGCQVAGCALLGGETAEMPDLYRDGEFDLSGFAVGRRVFRPLALPRPGDVLVGVASTGFHSNGYQLIRTVVEHSGHTWSERFVELDNMTLGEVVLRPTQIYVRAVMELWGQVAVRAMAHITGGGLIENVPRTLAGLGAQIRLNAWPRPAEMQLIQQWGHIEEVEMLHTFNCGIGFTVVVPEADVQKTQAVLQQHQLKAYAIGRVEEAPGVRFR